MVAMRDVQLFTKALRALTQIVPLLALLLVIAVFTLLDRVYSQGQFFSLANAFNIICENAFITVGALGMMLIIAAGGIDLSAGAMLGLACAVVAVGLKRLVPAGDSGIVSIGGMAILGGAVATGVLCGMLNGTLICAFRAAPFILTLGTMVIFMGAARVLSGDTTVSPDSLSIPVWLDQFSKASAFRLAYGWLPVIPLGVGIELVLAAVLTVVMKRTVFGRHVVALGSNELAARLSGIRITRLRVLVYTIAGALFGLSGVYLFTLVSSYGSGAGVGRELDLIAAVVIGGGSLRGGRAPVLGTVVGSLLIAVIRSGCVQIGVPDPWQYIIVGLIIICAVLMDRAAGRTE